MNNSYDLLIKELENLIVSKKISDLINLEKDNIYNKSAVPLIVKKYINENSLYNLNIFEDYKIRLKFIPVDNEYNCHEAMSFSYCSLCNILFEEWDSQDPYGIASLKKEFDFNYLFIPVIKFKKNGFYNNFMDWEIGCLSFWQPNDDLINLIGDEWSHLKKIIQNGIEIEQVKYGSIYRNNNNLPKQSETNYIHLRPHGKDSNDIDVKYHEYTNKTIAITKQSFWLNKKFINQLLINNKWKMNLKEE
jgi:DNA mismatch repair protein MutH